MKYIAAHALSVIGSMGGCVWFLRVGLFVKKPTDRQLQKRSKMSEAAGANTVNAAFILLQLLERNPYQRAQLSLTQAAHVAGKNKAFAYVNVNRVDSVFALHEALSGQVTQTAKALMPWQPEVH
jgi:hypothetical protein